jgi:2-polyprenyl-3-methyl-5-hydroxy-6-metoxy-1,4-benzoquinol methylase
MPTSTYSHIPSVVQYLIATRPNSILDVGLGNGKMGFIARDLLDVMLGERFKKADWKIKIDGLEVFPEYVQAHQKAIYDDIFIGDAFDTIDKTGKYDMIIVGDVLEHFEKQRAWLFLDKCAAHCNAYIMLNIPIGEGWIQGDIYGNIHETHLSFWKFEEFEPFTTEKALYEFPGIGHYGALLIKKDDYINFRAGKGPTTHIGELHPDILAEYSVVESLILEKKLLEAIRKLRDIIAMFPEEANNAKLYMERISALMEQIR